MACSQLSRTEEERRSHSLPQPRRAIKATQRPPVEARYAMQAS